MYAHPIALGSQKCFVVNNENILSAMLWFIAPPGGHKVSPSDAGTKDSS